MSKRYTILSQTTLTLTRAQYDAASGQLSIQEFSGAGLHDLVLTAEELRAILRLLPTSLLQAAAHAVRRAELEVPPAVRPLGDEGYLTLELEEPSSPSNLQAPGGLFHASRS